MRFFTGLVVAIALCIAPSLSFAELVVGQIAPEFSLIDTKGQVRQSADFKGQYVVLEWLNHDCPFVKKHYSSGNMQSLQKEYTAKGIVWLSINSSAAGKQGHYTSAQADQLTVEKAAAPTAVLLDGDGQVGHLYNAQTTPHMYIIDPQGILVYQGAIDDIPSADSADIPAAQNYVKAALDEILAGKPVSISATKSYGCSVKY